MASPLRTAILISSGGKKEDNISKKNIPCLGEFDTLIMEATWCAAFSLNLYLLMIVQLYAKSLAAQLVALGVSNWDVQGSGPSSPIVTLIKDDRAII